MQTTNYLDLDDLQCKQKEVGYFQTTIKISVANRRGKNTIKTIPTKYAFKSLETQ